MNLSNITFDPTIKLSDIFFCLTVLSGIVLAFHNMKSTLKIFGFRLDLVDANIEDLKRDFGNGKVQDTKIERLESDITLMRKEVHDLRYGRGYVQQVVDGTYMRHGKVAGVNE